jgi:hypothetical protein
MAKRPSKKAQKPTPVPVEPIPDDWLSVYEAVDQVREVLRKARPPRRPGGSDGWDRIGKHIGKHHSLSGSILQDVEHAIARAQQTWTDDQKRSLYRDLKTYVAADYRPDRDLDEDEDYDDEIEFAHEKWVDEPDEDDGWDIPSEYLDFATKDGLLDAVMSEASSGAVQNEERAKKTVRRARPQRRPHRRR